MTRQCGTCSACCRWPSIPEIEKPPRVTCEHLHKQGFRCTIYKDRPKACSSYRCSWLRDMGAEKDQPDKCGVLIDRRMTLWGYVLVAKQLEPFAAMTKRGKNAIFRAARDGQMLCLIIDYEDTDKVIGASAGGDKVKLQQFEKETNGVPVRLGGPKDFDQHVIRRVCEGQWPEM